MRPVIIHIDDLQHVAVRSDKVAALVQESSLLRVYLAESPNVITVYFTDAASAKAAFERVNLIWEQYRPE